MWIRWRASLRWKSSRRLTLQEQFLGSDLTRGTAATASCTSSAAGTLTPIATIRSVSSCGLSLMPSAYNTTYPHSSASDTTAGRRHPAASLATSAFRHGSATAWGPVISCAFPRSLLIVGCPKQLRPIAARLRWWLGRITPPILSLAFAQATRPSILTVANTKALTKWFAAAGHDAGGR